MAQFARRSFDAMRSQWCNIDVFDMQGNMMARAEVSAEICPRVGIRADTVMDM